MSVHRSDSSITLIVPDATLLLDADVLRRDGQILSRLAGRGSVQSTTIDPAFRTWETSLLESCGLLPKSEELASAPVCNAGATHQPNSGTWAHLEGVHFAAGLNDVSAMRLRGEATLREDEYSELTRTLSEHLKTDGLQLCQHQRAEWLLRFPRPTRASTLAPEHAFVGPLNKSLPTGEHGAELRRLMTEFQMLLHEHPVNIARARRGISAVNAIWLWGIGTIESHSQATRNFPAAYGSRSYLKGLYRMHGQSIRAETFTWETILKEARGQSGAIALIEVEDVASLERDWLAPIIREMRRGSVRHLTVHLGRWRIRVARHALFRFWRKALAPAEWST